MTVAEYASIPAELKALPQWVCANAGSKVPMKAWEPSPASSSDPATWSDFSTAFTALEAGYYDNIGFVFREGGGLVGIDIDCGWDEDGLLSPVAVDILGACLSYTEMSRSGRGFHILLRGSLPFKGRNNRQGVEIYEAARYFIMTGKVTVFRHIVENQEAIDYVVGRYFQETERLHEKSALNVRVYNPLWELPKNGHVQLRPVYPRIPAGSRNICLTSLAGMLHNQGYSKAQIYDELLYANMTACDPCLEKRELRSIVNSVTRYKR